MDPLVFISEALFGLTFVSAVRQAWIRRDLVSADVVLVFLPMTIVLTLEVVRLIAGGLDTTVSVLAISLLLAQPVFTLRLAGRLRTTPRWVVPLAAAAWAVTVVPLAAPILLGATEASPALLLAAVVVFVVGEAVAAILLADAARRRSSAGGTRLWIAAVATALFGLAILALGTASAASAAEPSPLIGRLLAILAGLGYVAAFLPPRPLRRAWHAQTAYGGLRELLAVQAEPPAAIWRRYLAIARAATDATAALLVVPDTDDPDGGVVAMVDGLSPALIGRPVGTTEPGEPGRRRIGDPRHGALGAFIEGAAAGSGAQFADVVRLGSGRAPLLILISRHRSLFADDDTTLVQALGQQAAALVEHREAIGRERTLSAELQAANKAKGDFLASMSHELRTPLNSIIGFSDLMRYEPATDGNVTVPVDWVDYIRNGGAHLLDLINDVLDLSKVEAGRLDLDREPVDVRAAVAASLAGVQPLADDKRLVVASDVPAGLIADADPGRFRQVMYNLLSNAIKFTPPDGRITVSGRDDPDGVRIAVADTGVGIASEDLDIVFEEFQQLGDAAQRTQGTGLGLALTRRLVEAHGGRIELTSTVGVGSTFSVIWPRAAVAPGQDGAASVADGSAARGPRPTLLLVEDDPSSVGLLRAYLEPAGYRVRTATTGERAIEEARADPPTAILLDVLLPSIDGWEVLRRLKGDPTLRDIPVVMVTVVDEREVGLALGAVDYLVKPVDREALLACLARLASTPARIVPGMRVLAIDDDRAALDAIEAILAPAGYAVDRAEDGRTAVDRAREVVPDLVICDLLMPDLDGFGVVQALKADPRTAAVPIVILTAHDLSTAEKRRLDGKVLGIMTKGTAAQAGLRALLDRADGGGHPDG